MAIIRDPISFAEHFRVDPAELVRLGVFNPILNVDTRLFIDPALLGASRHEAISNQASETFRSYFEDIIKLLRASNGTGDIAWRAAQKRLTFPEISATCLGYGAAGIRGSAFGPELSARLISTAKQIIDLGINDPDLFILLPLIEDGIGPDLISDLTTNVIVADLARFTESVARELGIATEEFDLPSGTVGLPRNPSQRFRTPVLLVPTDILRELPVASDWSEVADAASKTAVLRNRVNNLIGDIWSAKTRRDKAELREKVLSSREAFTALLDVIHDGDVRPYDLGGDPSGITAWRHVHETIAAAYPLALTLLTPPDSAKAISVVQQIIDHFQDLVENKGLWKLLWGPDGPHSEKVSQMVFFAVADAYCKANSLDVTPEADTGSGPVDFKFSAGYNVRVLVEIKLSTNNKLIAGYERQLETYKQSQDPIHAVYVVIDVGRLGKKDQQLLDVRNERIANGESASEIAFIDATPRKSASKR